MTISAIIMLVGFQLRQIGFALMEKEGAMMAKLPDGWVFITKAERMCIGLEEHELVMCKNCKHNDPFGCHKFGVIVSDNFYCAYGEKTGGTTDGCESRTKAETTARTDPGMAAQG